MLLTLLALVAAANVEVVVVADQTTAQIPAVAQSKRGVAVVAYAWPGGDISLQLLDEQLHKQGPPRVIGQGTQPVIAGVGDGYLVVYSGVGLQIVRVHNGKDGVVVDKPASLASGSAPQIVFDDALGGGLVVYDVATAEGYAVAARAVDGRGVVVGAGGSAAGCAGASQPVRVRGGWRFVCTGLGAGQQRRDIVVVDVDEGGAVTGSFGVALSGVTEPWIACGDDGRCAVVARDSSAARDVVVVVVDGGKEVVRSVFTDPSRGPRMATMPRVVVDGRGYRVLWLSSVPATWPSRWMSVLVDGKGTGDVAAPLGDVDVSGWLGLSIGKQRLVTGMNGDPNVPHKIIVARF